MVWVLDMFQPLLGASAATTWHESYNIVFLKNHNVFVLLLCHGSTFSHNLIAAEICSMHAAVERYSSFSPIAKPRQLLLLLIMKVMKYA